MEEKIEELIAIGASVTANCVPCLRYHTASAREAGASDTEIADAVAMGRKVRGGAAKVWDDAAATLLDEGQE